MRKYNLLFLTFFTLSCFAKTPLRLVTGDLPPFVGKGFVEQGPLTEVIATALKNLGYEFSIEFRPWSRGFEETKKSIFWGTFPYIKNNEREKDFVYSESIYTTNPKVFYRKDLKIKTLADLKDKKICSPVGYAINSVIKKTYPEVEKNIESPMTLEACAKMLVNKRADYFAIGLEQGKVALKSFGVKSSIEMADIKLDTIDYHLIVSKENVEGLIILKSFDQEIIRMKKHGQIKKIFKKHFELPIQEVVFALNL